MIYEDDFGLCEFFDPSDGFTTCITLEPSGVSLTGYFDIRESDFYLDDGESISRADFTCPAISNSASLVGNTVQIQERTYSVNAAGPDGTGVMTLVLMRT